MTNEEMFSSNIKIAYKIANKIGKSQAQVSRIRAKIIQKSKKRACL